MFSLSLSLSRRNVDDHVVILLVLSSSELTMDDSCHGTRVVAGTKGGDGRISVRTELLFDPPILYPCFVIAKVSLFTIHLNLIVYFNHTPYNHLIIGTLY